MNTHALAVAGLAFLASPAFPLSLFAIAATTLGALYLKFIKGTARQETVEMLAKRAFNVVEDLKATGRLPAGADKPVKALEILVPLLQAHGITMTSGIEDLARAIWGSMHAPDNAGPASTTELKVGGFQPTVQIVEDSGSKPSARRMGFLGAALVTAMFCLSSSGCAAFQKDLAASPACAGLTIGSVVQEDVTLISQLAVDIPAGQLAAVLASFTAAHGPEQAECVYDLVEAQLGHPVAQPAAPPSIPPTALVRAMGPPRIGALEALANFRAARAAAKTP